MYGIKLIIKSIYVTLSDIHLLN